MNLWRRLFRRTRSPAARKALTDAVRRLAFHGPPMSEEERRQHTQAVAAVRERDEARRQQQ